MTAGEPRHLPQRVDYLGFLGAKLRDLQGVATLAYELIQNADDVKDQEGQPGASRITFNIQQDALVVENDGIFRKVDFERMQNVASGGKREEEGTTGAFGIGFIAVYQVTDHPEIFTSGLHWTIRPEAPEHQRIEERDMQTEGTRFRLPWAFNPESEVRRKLRVEAVHPKQLPTFEGEIARALSLAALFLKQLKVLELKRCGELVKRVEREAVEDDQILIQDGDQTLIWRIFHGTFQDEAARLRLRHSWHIEDKRQSNVLVAIPDEPLDAGRLFAVLPSETIIPLPFHINADFFPTSDRKRIIFGNDYQSEWNRAAVRAAACALAAGFDKLPELLRPQGQGLWRLLYRLNECREQVEQGEHDRVFATFWEEIASGLQTRPIVFTTTGQWVVPGKARLLESEPEKAASPILEGLGIPVVHPDLRYFFGLLRQKEIGTPLLSLQDVVDALKRVGLTKRRSLAQAHPCLRSVEAWQTLWHALDALLDPRRQSPYEQEQGMEALRSCAIALDNAGVLWPPAHLFRGDTETKALFMDIRWLADYGKPNGVPALLVAEFTAEQAIAFLSGLPAERLSAACCDGKLDIEALYRWFETRRREVLSEPWLIEKLRTLPIWPVAGQFRPLSGLYIPGGFDDPLKLSALVDLEALGGRREFLKDLGVQELTFRVYVRNQVPRVLEDRPDLLVETRRQLVQLLAQRLGEIRDDNELQHRLSNLDLVECVDGQFRPAHQLYMQSDMVNILGDRVYMAAPVRESTDAVKAFYEWLGVAQEPRPDDVIQRIQELTTNPPDHAALQIVETVFEYLVNQWPKWNEDKQRQYGLLQKLAWLPASREQTRWHRPGELYAVFQSYLFETQATFLDLPRQLQNRAGTARLIEFLGIKTAPSPTLVVRHLKVCSERGTAVNREVYRFLKDNADDPALDQLKGIACLLLPDNRYVRPDQVFWSEHPFGPFRYRLGLELREYSALFERLGVREEPEVRDFIQVLLEISEQLGESNAPLDDQTHAVVMRCWEALNTALEEGRLSCKDLAELRERRVIPDPRQLLSKPENLFFEDRAGLAARFPQFLENSVIKRPLGAWQAMEAAGVRSLGQAIEVHLVEPPDSIEDTELAARVSERRLLIDRVIESEKALGEDGLDTTALDRLHFEQARELVIQYSLEAFHQKRTTDPELVPVLWMPEEFTLYVVHQNGDISWPAVARELAYAIKSVSEIGGLAGGIKEALANSTFDEANRTLDELGYPPLQQRVETEVAGTGVIEGLGGTDLTDKDKLDYPMPSQRTDTEALETGRIGDLSGTTLSPQEAISAILGGQGADRAAMPYTEPERPAGAGALGSGRRPSSQGKPRGKLRSYVIHDHDETKEERDTASAKRRPEVDQAGIEHVLEHERACGRTPTEMPHHHKGYDIESLESEGGMRYIEVKALSGEWSTRNAAGLTRPQFETARKLGDQFWLYVVERATSDDYQIYCIQDPANRVSQYLFDDGWQALAEVEEAIAQD